ncbi:MAG TPA: hypothetical protein VMQ93_08490 [Novosphingobium sp.]|nr:hypothetical protein [Novosphingobium sp.]
MSNTNTATGQQIPPSPVAAGGARRHRLSVAARTLAGTLGAYGATVQVTVAASLVLARLGMARVEAVTAATLASFAVFAAISMAVFHARSVARAWLWLAATALPLALLGWLLGPA